MSPNSTADQTWNPAGLKSSLHVAILTCLVAVISFIAVRMAGTLVIRPQLISPLWPGNVLVVSVLLLFQRRLWPVLVAAAFAGFIVSDLLDGLPLRSIALYILSDSVEILIAAMCLSYSFDGVPQLNSLKSLARYSLFAVILAPLAGSIICAIAFPASYWTAFRISFFTEALGFLILMPAILGWIQMGHSWVQKFRNKFLEAPVLFTALVFFGYLAFETGRRGYRPVLLYSLIPFLLWSALRFGPTGVSTSMIVIGFLSVRGAIHGVGPFTYSDPITNLMSLQSFLFLSAALFMVLAVLVEERKRTEEELLEAHRVARLGSWRWDPVTDVVSWSRELYRMAGYDPSQRPPTFKNHVQLFTPESWDRLRQKVEWTMRTGAPYELDLEGIRRDGVKLWLTSRGEAVRDAAGRIIQLRGTIQDITERMRAEEHFRLAVESAPNGMVIVDRVGKIILLNSHAETLFGYRREELVGQTIEILLPESLRMAHAGFRGDFSAHPAARPMGVGRDLQARRKDGSQFPVEIGLNPLRTSEGAQILCSIVDITERKSAERALRESEKRFRLVANSAPVMIWMSGTDKLCTFFNKGWLDFTGQTMEHEFGEGWAAGVHPEDLKRCLEVYSAAFDARVDFEMEYRLRRLDGKYRWIVDYGVPRFEPDGTFCGYIGSCLDFTDRKLSEESLEELSGRLITAQEEERARIARELHDDFSQRMALLGIGLRQIWKKLLDSDVEARAKVQELIKGTQELSSDMHSLSHELHSSRLEHVGLVPALIGLCEEMSAKYSITVEFNERGPFDAIPKDVALCLFRVAQEALSNVIKHSRAKQAQVGLTGVNEEIRLRITDSGVGFDLTLGSAAAGIGLVGMRERLRLVGGTLSVRSAHMRGTEILAQVTLRETAIEAQARARAAEG